MFGQACGPSKVTVFDALTVPKAVADSLKTGSEVRGQMRAKVEGDTAEKNVELNDLRRINERRRGEAGNCVTC